MYSETRRARTAAFKEQASQLVKEELQAASLKYWNPRCVSETREIVEIGEVRCYVYFQDVACMTGLKSCIFSTYVQDALEARLKSMSQRHIG